MYRVSASSAVRWMERSDATGSISPTPRAGKSRSPLEPHRVWLLELNANDPEAIDKPNRITNLKIGRHAVRTHAKELSIGRKAHHGRDHAGRQRDNAYPVLYETVTVLLSLIMRFSKSKRWGWKSPIGEARSAQKSPWHVSSQ